MIRIFITRALVCAAALFSVNAFAAVDANQASQAELESVKGIGPGLAGKILSARNAGNFKDWGDLVDRVGGVGPGNAARFSQAGLTVAGSSFSHQPAGAIIKPAAKARPSTAAEPSNEEKKAKRVNKAGQNKTTATPAA